MRLSVPSHMMGSATCSSPAPRGRAAACPSRDLPLETDMTSLTRRSFLAGAGLAGAGPRRGRLLVRG